jgi:exopolysaccharide biosynthesis polyprenyl glycosylphosphotransferase
MIRRGRGFVMSVVGPASIESQSTDVLHAPPLWQPESLAIVRTLRRPLAVIAAGIRQPPRSRLDRATKRTIDVIGSVLGLVVLSPLFVLLAIAVKATSRGPALFMQERCGLGGRLFKFYKFRTMVEDAEHRKAGLAHLNEMTGPVFKIQRDPRATRIGGLLRKLSLDELPQLWNVLRGDMSLVGPRPPTPDEVECYSLRQSQRLGVLPGLTGLWQVSGRSAIADFERWIDLDLEYAENWSVWLDLRILVRTVGVVILTRGAQ